MKSEMKTVSEEVSIINLGNDWFKDKYYE